VRSGFDAQPIPIARKKSSFVPPQKFRARQNSVVTSSWRRPLMCPSSCEMMALHWSASMAFENAPCRPRLRQCGNRTRTARLISATFLRSEVISLLEDHLMKLVPVVEIVEVHRVFRSRSVIRDVACTQNALARLIIVNVTTHRGVMLFNRVSIE
jgi:hypothetical protein